MNTVAKKHYRIKSRLRFTVFVVFAIIMFVTSTNAALGFYNASSLTVDEYISVEVCSGDTLWNIAQVYMPDIDTRSAVHEICSINNINASSLYPGQTIYVPVNY